MSLESLLAGLTVAEKLEAMDILWRDLTQQSSGIRSPDWHGKILRSGSRIHRQNHAFRSLWPFKKSGKN